LKAHVHICQDIRPHLIYANGSRAALYGGLAARLSGVPAIWHCRIVLPDPPLDSLLCTLCAGVIANSEATAHRFKAFFQHKIRVIYNGIDLTWLRDATIGRPSSVLNDWKVILVVARASRDKRHDIILASFDRVAKDYPETHLYCLGSADPSDPEWWDHLQQVTRKSQFRERIHWVGEVIDVRPWYRASYVLILVSDNESFGRVLVEGMACGVPVIATSTGGIPEVVRDRIDGILIPPGNADELAKAIIRMIENPGLREEMVKSGLKRAESFGMDEYVRKIHDIFAEASR
jgi:glycosyltransferase involved in cell wall biosynthesis